MNLQVTIPAGLTRIISYEALHQWDYGRKLEITASCLAGLGQVEVHFAHAGMKEAIVYFAPVVEQTLTVAVPDIVLEQPTTVFAWVYVPTEEEGRTILTVLLPIEARTRPSGATTKPPESYIDRYTELLAAAADLINHTYTREEIDTMLNDYIDAVNSLVGGDD